MLQSSARISGLVKKALELKQTALALTDHGNMFGMLEFHTDAKKTGIKALIGCDLYVAPGPAAEPGLLAQPARPPQADPASPPPTPATRT